MVYYNKVIEWYIKMLFPLAFVGEVKDGVFMKKYINRIADKVLKQRLEEKGAILLEGAKWCGKTTTAEQLAGSVIYMQNPKNRKQNIELAEINPELILQGDTPRLIDEWQLAPVLWDAVRFEVDQRDAWGQFILTGSTTPTDKSEISHSGTGRIGRMLMRPMSLLESGDSEGGVSLKDLFEGNTDIAEKNKLELTDIAFLICRGGWPKAIDAIERVALRQSVDYVDAVVENDMRQYDGIDRDPSRIRRLLRSYARNISSQAKISHIYQDVITNESDSISQDTIYSYIKALKAMFVIEELEAWNPNLRSKSAIRTSNTLHFVDPSIATASLGVSPGDLINDLNTFGLMFESMCVRDLRVYADYLDGKVYHYRDQTGLECDAVVHLRNGKYGLIEVKLGGQRLIEEGATNLIKLQKTIDTSKMKEPSFMMVLTATGDYAFKRKDGVLVVPVGCLGI